MDTSTLLGLVDEDEIILEKAALLLASLDRPDADLAFYQTRPEDGSARIRAVVGDAAITCKRVAA